MDKIKILFIIENFTPATGGGENFARMLAEILTSMGCSVVVVSREFDSINPAIKHIKVPGTHFMRLINRIIFAFYVPWAVRRDNFNAVFAFSKSFGMDIYRPGGGVHLAYRKYNIRSYNNIVFKVFQRVKDLLSPEQWFLTWLEKKQYSSRKLKKVIAVSNMVRRHVKRWYRLDDSMIEVIYNGVDLEKYHTLKKENTGAVFRRELHILDEVVILFVANNFRLKGLRTVFMALSMLDSSLINDVRLLVAGRGKIKRWKQMALRLGIDRNVIFLGQQKEMSTVYAASDIFILPSFYDPCANVCLEALASSVPVITSSSNGSSEIMEEGKEGFIIKDADDFVGFAAKIEFLLKNRKSRLEMAENARKLAEKYSIKLQSEKIIRVIKDVMETK
ncbi:glycosyltransferase family 4 protein [bacterium]|jgi:UDP-glucose:(heptosyl)LPS alpha-1,3-glucosyltransferase|nr:glycosyltransferase family 4 protein [bacterium]